MRNGAKTTFARGLRRSLTGAETRLWFYLRRGHLAGFRFRRQHPLGAYIVDSVCLEARLVVEMDGSQRLCSTTDSSRDAWLRSQDFKVLPFWNDDVLQRTDAVLADILSNLVNA
ncbi:MAG: DUF559 domain-containing protein [Dokdonella sp.]|uniref:endonuclease domain-containing protein n=1 Tax=Dokdonella sp. TaxID=2291710 RepID=UPI0032644031